MKRNKVESILLIAVLALSIQTGSYSAAITDRELDQYYAKNIQKHRCYCMEVSGMEWKEAEKEVECNKK